MDENGLDLYETIIPVYILSKILALAPFKLEGQRGNRKFIRTIGVIRTIQILTILCVMFYAGYTIEKLKLQYDLKGTALRFELYMGTILTIIMFLRSSTNTKLVIGSVEDIAKIDSTMQTIGITISYKNAKRFSSFQITAISIVFLSKAAIQFIYSDKLYMTLYSIFNIVDYINTITLFQYVDFLLLLRQRYIWLNRNVKTLALSSRSCWTMDLKSAARTDPVRRVQILAKAHSDLYDVGQKVNRAYSIQLLVTVGMRFTMITTQLLTTYKTIFEKSQNATSTITYVLITIYLFLHSSKIFMIASLSANTMDKAKQTAIELHKIWTYRSDLRENINYFSMQIMQQNHFFHAGGFFALDYTLIYNILGALTTYLLILIQFDSSGKK